MPPVLFVDWIGWYIQKFTHFSKRFGSLGPLGGLRWVGCRVRPHNLNWWWNCVIRFEFSIQYVKALYTFVNRHEHAEWSGREGGRTTFSWATILPYTGKPCTSGSSQLVEGVNIRKDTKQMWLRPFISPKPSSGPPWTATSLITATNCVGEVDQGMGTGTHTPNSQSRCQPT